jgi:hypothetical protein
MPDAPRSRAITRPQWTALPVTHEPFAADRRSVVVAKQHIRQYEQLANAGSYPMVVHGAK